jgi:hypothetical protein
MAKQPKLSDMQLVLLSTASQREDGNLFPIADSLKGGESRINKAIEALIKCGFAAEGEVGAKVPNWREDGDRRLGAMITAAGRATIGAAEGGEVDKGQEPPATPPPAAPAPARKPGEIRAGTKQALLVEMLEREEGASIQQIVHATGWLPHTTRAALTGLKKRGYEITNEKVEGVGRYHAKKVPA